MLDIIKVLKDRIIEIQNVYLELFQQEEHQFELSAMLDIIKISQDRIIETLFDLKENFRIQVHHLVQIACLVITQLHKALLFVLLAILVIFKPCLGRILEQINVLLELFQRVEHQFAHHVVLDFIKISKHRIIEIPNE